MTRILGISGSLRRGSYNTALLRAGAPLLDAGAELEINVVCTAVPGDEPSCVRRARVAPGMPTSEPGGGSPPGQPAPARLEMHQCRPQLRHCLRALQRVPRGEGRLLPVPKPSGESLVATAV
jgi:hypothetical protein